MRNFLEGEIVSDEALIEKIARADESALGELYGRYNRLIFGIALNAVGNEESAKEITQDVFLRVWKKAYSYNVERGKVYTWLTRMARNRAIDMLRRRSSRPSNLSISWLEDKVEVHHTDKTPEMVAALENDKQRVRAAVAALPESQKQAIALAYFKGYTHSQIAESLNLPLGTVKGRIRAGMKKLRQYLEREEKSDTSKSSQ